MTVWLALLGVPSTALAQQYVVVDHAQLYTWPKVSAARVTVRKQRVLELTAKRGNWYELWTMGHTKPGCARGVGPARVRLYVRANRLRRSPPKGKSAFQAGCGRFAGWVTQAMIAPSKPVQVAGTSMRRKRAHVVVGAKLYWPNGIWAGAIDEFHEVAQWLLPPSGKRPCVDLRLWPGAARTRLCVPLGWLLTGPKPAYVHMRDLTRIAGIKRIIPSQDTKYRIKNRSRRHLVAVVVVCIDPRGRVLRVGIAKSSGFSGYDHRLQGTIKRTWRFKPYVEKGHAVHACAPVTFVYNQRNN